MTTLFKLRDAYHSCVNAKRNYPPMTLAHLKRAGIALHPRGGVYCRLMRLQVRVDQERQRAATRATARHRCTACSAPIESGSAWCPLCDPSC